MGERGATRTQDDRMEDESSIILVLGHGVGERLARQAERQLLIQSVSDIFALHSTEEIPGFYRELCERLSWEHVWIVRPEMGETSTQEPEVDASAIEQAVDEVARRPFLCAHGATCAADHQIDDSDEDGDDGDGARLSRSGTRVEVSTLGDTIGRLGQPGMCTEQQWVLLREFWQDACLYNVLDYVVSEEEPSEDAKITRLYRRMQRLMMLWEQCAWDLNERHELEWTAEMDLSEEDEETESEDDE